MKHVVIVRTHFRETDQLKLEKCQNIAFGSQGLSFVRVLRIIGPVPIHNFYIFSLLWVAAYGGGKSVAVRYGTGQQRCSSKAAVRALSPLSFLPLLTPPCPEVPFSRSLSTAGSLSTSSCPLLVASVFIVETATRNAHQYQCRCIKIARVIRKNQEQESIRKETRKTKSPTCLGDLSIGDLQPPRLLKKRAVIGSHSRATDEGFRYACGHGQWVYAWVMSDLGSC